ncbi:MAG TPA: hypothetical protein VK543_07055, partial [Puia sp.]|nr:hypothetical protein [Puia sp.]
MLQLAFIRQHPDLVKERLAIRHFKGIGLVDTIIELDEQRKKWQATSDTTLSQLNTTSKEIGQLIAKGDKEKAESKKKEVAFLKAALQPVAAELSKVESQLNEALVTLPNLPAAIVPPGTTPADNVVVREAGQKPNLPPGSVPHWELAKKFNLIDFELGNKITGSGFPVYVNKGAKLQRALIQYFLDYNTAAGFTEYQPPLMVNEDSAFGT